MDINKEIMDIKNTPGFVSKTESVRHLCHLEVILYLLIKQ